MNDEIAVFLCCLTPNMALPWAESGVECYCVDTQHLIRKPRRVLVGAGAINFVWGDVRAWRPPENKKNNIWSGLHALHRCCRQWLAGLGKEGRLYVA